MNAITPLEAHRRAKALERELITTRRIKELGEALVHLAEVRNASKSPLDKTQLWAEFYAAKAAKAYYGEDVDDWFQIACENLNVDEDGEPVTDPDDYDEFARSHRQSVWGM
ncbi:MAG: hypothetical protein AAGB23_05385 [Pseudomonadota bacterium]